MLNGSKPSQGMRGGEKLATPIATNQVATFALALLLIPLAAAGEAEIQQVMENLCLSETCLCHS